MAVLFDEDDAGPFKRALDYLKVVRPNASRESKLFISQCLDGIEMGGFPSRIEPEEDADDGGKHGADRHGSQGYRGSPAGNEGR